MQGTPKPVGIATATYDDEAFFVVVMDDGSVWYTHAFDQPWTEGEPLPNSSRWKLPTDKRAKPTKTLLEVMSHSRKIRDQAKTG
jgi:hypothetical protein